jgi:hypothetical protein
MAGNIVTYQFHSAIQTHRRSCLPRRLAAPFGLIVGGSNCRGSIVPLGPQSAQSVPSRHRCSDEPEAPSLHVPSCAKGQVLEHTSAKAARGATVLLISQVRVHHSRCPRNCKKGRFDLDA